MPPSEARGSRDHLRIALQARPVVHPCSYISMPAQAIMAALSVHNSIGGKTS